MPYVADRAKSRRLRPCDQRGFLLAHTLPYLGQLVRRVEAGEMTIDHVRLDLSDSRRLFASMRFNDHQSRTAKTQGQQPIRCRVTNP